VAIPGGVREALSAAEWFQLCELCEESRERREALNPNTRKIVIDLERAHTGWGKFSIAVGEFYERCRPLIEWTEAVVEELLAGRPGAGEEHGLEALYATGGGSELPAVARVLKEKYGRRVRRSAYMRSATAIGLTIAADDRSNIGHFRYAECTGLEEDGQRAGNLTIWDDTRFSFDPAPRESEDRSSLPVERDLAGEQSVEEEYTCDASGIVSGDHQPHGRLQAGVCAGTVASKDAARYRGGRAGEAGVAEAASGEPVKPPERRTRKIAGPWTRSRRAGRARQDCRKPPPGRSASVRRRVKRARRRHIRRRPCQSSRVAMSKRMRGQYSRRDGGMEQISAARIWAAGSQRNFSSNGAGKGTSNNREATPALTSNLRWARRRRAIRNSVGQSNPGWARSNTAISAAHFRCVQPCLAA